MEALAGIFSAFGLSASAGLNAYIPLLVIALLGRFTDLITLSSPWDTLESWWIIGLLTFLSLIEFFADKAPAVNHINDMLQTIVRPVAGAIVFAASAQVITEIHPVISMAAGLFTWGLGFAPRTRPVRTSAETATLAVRVICLIAPSPSRRVRKKHFLPRTAGITRNNQCIGDFDACQSIRIYPFSAVPGQRS